MVFIKANLLILFTGVMLAPNLYSGKRTPKAGYKFVTLSCSCSCVAVVCYHQVIRLFVCSHAIQMFFFPFRFRFVQHLELGGVASHSLWVPRVRCTWIVRGWTPLRTRSRSLEHVRFLSLAYLTFHFIITSYTN